MSTATMTEDEFFEKLAELPGQGWKCYRHAGRSGDAIRLFYQKSSTDEIAQFCPITAVCYSLGGCNVSPGEYRLAADRLGLPPLLAEEIARATDYVFLTDKRHIELRNRLLATLQACRL